MEFGELRYESDHLEKGDLDVRLSGAVIINAPIGSLMALRANLKDAFGDGIKFFTMSSQLLYVVNWNDLSEGKRKQLQEKRRT